MAKKKEQDSDEKTKDAMLRDLKKALSSGGMDKAMATEAMKATNEMRFIFDAVLEECIAKKLFTKKAIQKRIKAKAEELNKFMKKYETELIQGFNEAKQEKGIDELTQNYFG